MFIIGVTKCPVGVAHTYMAAEKLEATGKKLGHTMKIETQGSVGTENYLTEEDVKNADYVIIAADVEIENKERFNGKKVLELNIKQVIKDPQGVIESLSSTAKIQQGNISSEDRATTEKDGNSIVKQLMNGVSHMIPFVVLGGLFIAISLALGGTATEAGFELDQSSFWGKVNSIGTLGFSLMLPILSGFIAHAIAGRAALAPAMICALVANDATILGTKAGTGFIGAIIVAFLAGYIVKWINTWKVPKSLRAVMPIFIIPIITVSIISALFIFVVGTPVSWLMTSLESILTTLSENPSTSIILGLILGAMVAVDMGGPINKVAFLFGVASIAAGTPTIMGAVACAIPVAPLAMGVASLIDKNKYSEEEQALAIPSILMGLIGISEGAIPFASADPKRVIPSIIIGSSISGAMGMFFNITDSVPHGGPIVGLLGATNNMLLFLLCIVVGTAVSAVLVNILKRKK